MTPQQQQAYVTAAAAALELPLHPQHLAGVLQYFAIAARFAEQVQAVPLSPRDECAMVFVPVEPAGGTP